MSKSPRDQSPVRTIEVASVVKDEFLQRLDTPSATDVWAVLRCDWEDNGLAFEGHFRSKQAAKLFRKKILERLEAQAINHRRPEARDRYRVVRLPVLDAETFPYERFF